MWHRWTTAKSGNKVHVFTVSCHHRIAVAPASYPLIIARRSERGGTTRVQPKFRNHSSIMPNIMQIVDTRCRCIRYIFDVDRIFYEEECRIGLYIHYSLSLFWSWGLGNA